MKAIATHVFPPRRGAVARAMAAVITPVALMLIVTACSGSPSSVGAPTGSSSSKSSTALAFAECMRSHAVPSYPDPDASGTIPKKSAVQLGVTDGQLQSAENSCQHLLPNGGSGPDQAQQQHERTLSLKFAECMRSHGVALPDPGGSRDRIPDPASIGIDQGSPQFQAANQACRTYRPAYMPSNAAYNAWLRTQG